jgi:ribulose-phosphate 3-epimerase
MEISTSILNASNRREVILKLNESLTDYIHFDVMDGEFVENTQFQVEELVELLKVSNKKNDVHLMVKKPLKYIEAIKDLNVEYITIHAEINENISEILDFIKDNNIKCGLAIDLDTDINLIKPYLDKIDLVLIMSVKAGYGGQEFEPKVLTKLNEISPNVKIELDGGIDNKTISLIKNADIVVSGTYILKNIDKNILELKNANN